MRWWVSVILGVGNDGVRAAAATMPRCWVEPSVATMTGMSHVGDVALDEVVGSSQACPWVCISLFVVDKSKLMWCVPLMSDDWRQPIGVPFGDLPWLEFLLHNSSLKLKVFCLVARAKY